ncbi:hypothetical protein O181_020940 [Austropuccinia psidii MF-1]|uniref:Uncharacterized protein n=1 Tax=Austropuccinia psidii MF-1 TaxID=1389203 RepID=A0A9Q3GWK9_9BASI|nr:hypothetical protein [Austropuccinia psidii MF-1]
MRAQGLWQTPPPFKPMVRLFGQACDRFLQLNEPCVTGPNGSQTAYLSVKSNIYTQIKRFLSLSGNSVRSITAKVGNIRRSPDDCRLLHLHETWYATLVLSKGQTSSTGVSLPVFFVPPTLQGLFVCICRPLENLHNLCAPASNDVCLMCGCHE